MMKKYILPISLLYLACTHSLFASQQAEKSEAEESQTLLHQACEKGDLLQVQNLLKNPAIDVNAIDQNGNTPLISAVDSYEFSQNEDQTRDYVHIIKTLAQHKNIKINAQNKDKNTALGVFIEKLRDSDRKEDEEVIDALLVNTKLDINTKISSEYDEYEHPLIEIFEWLCKREDKGFDVAIHMINHPKMDINFTTDEDKTILMSLIDNHSEYMNQQGFDRIIKAIVKHQHIKLDLEDSNGDTALIYAFQKSKLRSNCIISLLLNHGANTTKINKLGLTPFMHACKYYTTNPHIIGLLFKLNNINFNATCNAGYTALEYFIKRKSPINMQRAIEDESSFQNVITLLQNTDVVLSDEGIYNIIEELYNHTKGLLSFLSSSIMETERFFKKNYAPGINTLAMHYGFGMLRKSIDDPTKIDYSHRLKFIQDCIHFSWTSSSQDKQDLDFNKMSLLTTGFLRSIHATVNIGNQIDTFSGHIMAYNPDFSPLIFSSIEFYKYANEDLKAPLLGGYDPEIKASTYLLSTGVLLPPIAALLSYFSK
ncbi:MAG: ankyrin repeat domain-containing protein [Bacteroidota bacterium]